MGDNSCLLCVKLFTIFIQQAFLSHIISYIFSVFEEIKDVSIIERNMSL